MHISFTVDFDMERQEIHTAFSSAFTNWEKNDEDSEEKAEQSRICRQIMRQNGEGGFVREAEIMWIIELIEQRIVEYQKDSEELNKFHPIQKDIDELNKMDPRPMRILETEEAWRFLHQRGQENYAQRIEEMEEGIKVLRKGAKLIATATAGAFHAVREVKP